MTALLEFPSSLMREGTTLWELRAVAIGGGISAAGQEALTRLDGGGLWKATLGSIPLRTAAQVRAWRALTAICDGGAQPIIVRMCDRRHFPAPTAGGSLLYSLDDAPHSDTSAHSDGSEYESSVVRAYLAEDADLRATSLRIEIAAGGELQGGEYFSIDHEEELRHRLYRVRTAEAIGYGTYDVTIRPPLRAAAAFDTIVEFDRPACVMRVASGEAMDLQLEMRKYAQPTVSFVEAFPPFPE